MHIKLMRRRKNRVQVTLYPAVIALVSIVSSIFSPATFFNPLQAFSKSEPYEQDFLVTAYYSPLPGQAAYFRGSYEEDITFNGKGIAGADGTPVYVGMIAAPPEYAFGTRIQLDGFGVGAVHDRGGRIIQWSDDLHRIDVWMGSGEEGLARALTWGARYVKGTVYPEGSEQPTEKFSVANIPADTGVLALLPKSDPMLSMLDLQHGDSKLAVRQLQTILKDLGYLDRVPTGTFGDETKAALKNLQNKYAINAEGDLVDERTNALLLASTYLKDTQLPKVAIGAESGTNAADVRQIQKLMRYLGYYRGRTNGVFSDSLKQAVAAFQIASGIVSQPTDQFAGTIGPKTKQAILDMWLKKQVSRKTDIVMMKVRLAKRMQDEGVPQKYLAKGDKGDDVKALQKLLIAAGYLDPKDITANFGERTQKALLEYQIDREIVKSADSKGAGIFGPATKQKLLTEAVDIAWAKIRSGQGTL